MFTLPCNVPGCLKYAKLEGKCLEHSIVLSDTRTEDKLSSPSHHESGQRAGQDGTLRHRRRSPRDENDQMLRPKDKFSDDNGKNSTQEPEMSIHAPDLRSLQKRSGSIAETSPSLCGLSPLPRIHELHEMNKFPGLPSPIQHLSMPNPPVVHPMNSPIPVIGTPTTSISNPVCVTSVTQSPMRKSTMMQGGAVHVEEFVLRPSRDENDYAMMKPLSKGDTKWPRRKKCSIDDCPNISKTRYTSVLSI